MDVYTTEDNRAKHILTLIKEGIPMSDIVKRYPTMYETISQLMIYRQPREGRTFLLYMFGESGIGKTTMVSTVLKAIKEVYGYKYFSKGGGLSQYWDGYDNQPIAWIDDPVNPDAQDDKADIQQLKTIISMDSCIIEIKHGSMVFDSKLVIITSNMEPSILADCCGLYSRQAVYNRLTNTCGAFHITRERVNLTSTYKWLIATIAAALDCNIEFEKVFERMYRLKEPDFNEINLLFK